MDGLYSGLVAALGRAGSEVDAPHRHTDSLGLAVDNLPGEHQPGDLLAAAGPVAPYPVTHPAVAGADALHRLVCYGRIDGDLFFYGRFHRVAGRGRVARLVCIVAAGGGCGQSGCGYQ